jgi:hypothetical protein
MAWTLTSGPGDAKIVKRQWRLQELQTESGGVWRARLGFGGDGESTAPLLVVLVTPWGFRQRQRATGG